MGKGRYWQTVVVAVGIFCEITAIKCQLERALNGIIFENSFYGQNMFLNQLNSAQDWCIFVSKHGNG